MVPNMLFLGHLLDLEILTMVCSSLWGLVNHQIPIFQVRMSRDEMTRRMNHLGDCCHGLSQQCNDLLQRLAVVEAMISRLSPDGQE